MYARLLKLGPLPAVIAAQAVVLGVIGLFLDPEIWPVDNPVILVPLVTLAFVWPTVVLFIAAPGGFPRAAMFASAYAAMSVLLGLWTGWQATPVDAFNVGALYPVYIVSMLAAGYIAVAVMQRLVAREPIRYDALFDCAWRNVLVAGLSLALVAGVAILLALWAALFAILGIDILAETFSEPWFFLPAIGIAFGAGTILFGHRIAFIDGIIGLVASLARYLLPVVLLVDAVFLAVFPFVGPQALWGEGLGSEILVTLGAIAVLLSSLAYRPEAGLAYPRSVQAAVSVVTALLPVLPALALAGILIRVNQYGWTVSRCWALTFAALVAFATLGYAWNAIRRRTEWPQGIGGVNMALGGLLLAVLLLQNTPLLDFRAIAASSQLARVESGEIDAAQFDFPYAYVSLARPGHVVAEKLVAELGFDPRQSGIGFTVLEDRLDPGFWTEVDYRGEPFSVPDDVRAAIDQRIARGLRIEHPTLVRTELDGDPSHAEYLLLGIGTSRNWRGGSPVSYGVNVYAVVDPGDGWQLFHLSTRTDPTWDDPDSVREILREAPIVPVKPRYANVRIGETTYRVGPRVLPGDDILPPSVVP